MPEIPSPSQTIGPLYGFALMFEGSHEAAPPDSPGGSATVASFTVTYDMTNFS